MNDPFIFKVLASVALIGGSMLIGLYVREPWRKSEFGRAFMSLAIGVWLFALTSTLRQWLGLNYWGRQELRIVAQLFCVYAVWSAWWVLLKTRRRDRRPIRRTEARSEEA